MKERLKESERERERERERADYRKEKVYFSITFVKCTMCQESKIARVEIVSVGIAFN